MSVSPHILPDATAAAAACARYIADRLEEALSRAESATFAVSGGSTPKLLFDDLAVAALPWDRVHIFWVDERCVAPTDDQSNYKLANQHLIRPANIPEGNVHRIYGELSPAQAATRYAADITGFFGLEPDALPQFDVVHLGLGPDAHTASLFPGGPLIEDRKSIAGPAYVEKFQQWRVTLLPGVLVAARHIVFLAPGEDKAEAVRNVFEAEYDPPKYPAQLASRQGRGVTWFLDDAAAHLLHRAAG